MASLHERFSGLFIPHVTPFDESGALDLESLTRLTKHFSSLARGRRIWSPARASAKARCSSIDEKRRVYEVSGKAAREAGKVHIATIAPQSTDEAVGLMRDLENLPVDGVMIFPPLLFAWGKVDPESQSPLLRRPGARNQTAGRAFSNTGEKLLLRSRNHLPHRPSGERRRL